MIVNSCTRGACVIIIRRSTVVEDQGIRNGAQPPPNPPATGGSATASNGDERSPPNLATGDRNASSAHRWAVGAGETPPSLHCHDQLRPLRPEPALDRDRRPRPACGRCLLLAARWRPQHGSIVGLLLDNSQIRAFLAQRPHRPPAVTALTLRSLSPGRPASDVHRVATASGPPLGQPQRLWAKG
ncbi:hypothetical protein VTN02DRAFT_6680 [Thermoascus thermophilus]